MVKLAAHVVFLILLRVSAQIAIGEDEGNNGGIQLGFQLSENREAHLSEPDSAISENTKLHYEIEESGVSLLSSSIAEQRNILDDTSLYSLNHSPLETDNVNATFDLDNTSTDSSIAETISLLASPEFIPETVIPSSEITMDILSSEEIAQNQELIELSVHVVAESESTASSSFFLEEVLSTTSILNPFSPVETTSQNTTEEQIGVSDISSQSTHLDSSSASNPLLSTHFIISETTQTTSLEKPRLLSKTPHIPASSETKEGSLISDAHIESSSALSHVSRISDLAELATQETSSSTNEEAVNISNMSRQNQGEKTYSEEGKFLSFEQWKKLKEAGSQLELSGEVKLKIEGSKAKNQNVSNASSTHSQPSTELVAATFEDQGRVYKDKFNYASVDCAATIVKTNSDAKGASAILTEVKDSYLLNKCSASSKFVVIELCQDILVSSVVMGNFELFSSMFRIVKFSVSDRFPVTKGWHELGQFEAQNIRDTQTFSIENPLIWARYLKIEIVSHYGNEFYCPISLVRVHGKTMMEEFKDTDQDREPAFSEPQQILTPTKEFLNNSAEFDSRYEECKVLTPYLALNKFLKDLNTTDNYCDVPLVSINVSHTTTSEPTNNKPTQESIFQNIVKRLSLLETNATLSLLYVEEQSKLLSDAFFNLEHRQVRKFENLLIHLNETMYTQVLYLEKAVEKIKTDSIRLFQAQSSQSHTSINSLRKETLSFAREISFLRKVVIADTLIILSLLAYVIMTRETLSVEELIGKQKQQKEQLPINDELSVIKPFSHRHNRSKSRRRKHN